MPPALDFGAPVAQNVQAPNGLQTLSSLMDLQQKQQQIQSNSIELQKQQQIAQERQSITRMMQSGVDDQGNKFKDANGEPDLATMLPAVMRTAPITGPAYIQNITKTYADRTALRTASLSLGTQQRQALMGPLQAIATNPNDPAALDGASQALDLWQKQQPEMTPVVQSARNLLQFVRSAQTPEARAHLANAMSALLQPGQAVQTQPQQTSVNNGQSTLMGTTSPPVAGSTFTPTTGVQMQVPPGAPTADANGNPRYVGVRPNQQAGETIPSGPQLGQPEAATAQVGENQKHYGDVQALAGAAPVRIHLLNEIDSLAHAAATGDNSAWKTFVSKVAGYTGRWDEKQTANDLMNKNLARLSTGNTDVARLLAQSSNPGDHMTEAAIHSAVRDLMAQEKVNQAAGSYFSGTKFDGPEYANKRAAWNSVNPYEYAKMSPSDRADMRNNLRRNNPDAYKALEVQIRAMGSK